MSPNVLNIKTLPLGPLETNCHIAWTDPTEQAGPVCWVFDVGMWSKPLVEFLNENDLIPQCALLTHGHGDHIGGLEYLKEKFPEIKIYCPAADVEMLSSPELNLSATFLMGLVAPAADETLQPGQTLQMGELTWQTLDTSGHTPGGMSFYCPQANVVMTGDALFASSIGRTDIPNGNHEQLVGNIRTNLLTLPGETKVLPGHGPNTTIANEKAANPYL